LKTIISNNKCKYRNVNHWSLITSIIFFVQAVIPVFSQNRLSQLVQNSKPSVFSIITYDKKSNPMAYGTGFFIDAKGTGITNYHVLAGANSAQIKTLDGNHYQINNIISESEKMDIIKFSIGNEANRIFPYLKLCQSQPIEAEDVFVIGNPKELEYSVSNGIISSIRNIEDLGRIVQTTAPISSGNSGSPLINMKGEVLGVISFTLLEGQNLNFAISVSNFTKMESINQYLFPTAVENSSSKIDDIFKKFEWKTSSADVVQNETRTFMKKDKTLDGDLRLCYRGIIASIDVEVCYIFVFDELASITIRPIRPWPGEPKKIDGMYGDNLDIMLKEYFTLKKTLIKVLGNDFGECAETFDKIAIKMHFCQYDNDYEKDKSKFLICDDFTKSFTNLNELKDDVTTKWKIPERNTGYSLRIYPSLLDLLNWNLHLNIYPIDK
jgi:hypothetical protein